MPPPKPTQQSAAAAAGSTRSVQAVTAAPAAGAGVGGAGAPLGRSPSEVVPGLKVAAKQAREAAPAALQIEIDD
eukprot:1154799-Pelagomonas_calceolata.AAC.7